MCNYKPATKGVTVATSKLVKSTPWRRHLNIEDERPLERVQIPRTKPQYLPEFEAEAHQQQVEEVIERSLRRSPLLSVNDDRRIRMHVRFLSRPRFSTRSIGAGTFVLLLAPIPGEVRFNVPLVNPYRAPDLEVSDLAT